MVCGAVLGELDGWAWARRRGQDPETKCPGDREKTQQGRSVRAKLVCREFVGSDSSREIKILKIHHQKEGED